MRKFSNQFNLIYDDHIIVSYHQIQQKSKTLQNNQPPTALEPKKTAEETSFSLSKNKK